MERTSLTFFGYLIATHGDLMTIWRGFSTPDEGSKRRAILTSSPRSWTSWKASVRNNKPSHYRWTYQSFCTSSDPHQYSIGIVTFVIHHLHFSNNEIQVISRTNMIPDKTASSTRAGIMRELCKRYWNPARIMNLGWHLGHYCNSRDFNDNESRIMSRIGSNCAVTTSQK